MFACWCSLRALFRALCEDQLCYGRPALCRTVCRLGDAQVPLEDAFEWSGSRSIMDVGGGRGEMLARCMACAGPQCRGILMDRPWVLDRRAPPSCPSSGLSWPCRAGWFALALASRVADKWLLCCCWSMVAAGA